MCLICYRECNDAEELVDEGGNDTVERTTISNQKSECAAKRITYRVNVASRTVQLGRTMWWTNKDKGVLVEGIEEVRMDTAIKEKYRQAMIRVMTAVKVESLVITHL
ncbi:hypothetical protein A2U01_0002293 [Trifolium medium]|uniref:Uncharacterized protein n=1 Tax=Trifolium medium TaxID=97028 RepID=A0A392M539_9FABA|nr:hypothetical protein [Trifolium medium]